MAQITTVLAQAGMALFALSIFETDYILVKREQVAAAQEAFTSAGMKVRKARQKAKGRKVKRPQSIQTVRSS